MIVFKTYEDFGSQNYGYGIFNEKQQQYSVLLNYFYIAVLTVKSNSIILELFNASIENYFRINTLLDAKKAKKKLDGHFKLTRKIIKRIVSTIGRRVRL